MLNKAVNLATTIKTIQADRSVGASISVVDQSADRRDKTTINASERMTIANSEHRVMKSESRHRGTPTRTPKKSFTPQKNFLIAGSGKRGHAYSAVKPRLENVYDSNPRDYSLNRMLKSYKKENKKTAAEISKLKAKRKLFNWLICNVVSNFIFSV